MKQPKPEAQLVSIPTDICIVPLSKLAYSRPEAAYAIGISLRSLDRMLKAGLIGSRRIGRRRIIPVESLRLALQREDLGTPVAA